MITVRIEKHEQEEQTVIEAGCSITQEEMPEKW